MATFRQRGNVWEFTVKCKAAREKPFYFTFEDKDTGVEYCQKLESLLKQGLVPPDLVEPNREFVVVSDVAKAYVKAKSISDDDKTLLRAVLDKVGGAYLSQVNYIWAENWIQKMKSEDNLAPSTIRHYVGALARCFDWGSKRGIPDLAVNPLRLLARGYATYNDNDCLNLKAGTRRVDIERDRRLESGEEEAIRAVLNREADVYRQRPLTLHWQGALECLFDLSLETAMRMRETYTLTVDQVNVANRTIFLDKTKNGDKRQVPLSTVAIRVINLYIKQVESQTRGMEGFSMSSGRLFPWWNGSFNKTDLHRASAKLSKQYSRVFNAAGCENLHYHDLRHEATSRLFERTTLSEGEIMKITGHKDIRVLLRYANLKGSNLAQKLW